MSNIKKKKASMHRSTNSIIGFNKDDGTVIEPNSIFIDQKQHKETKNLYSAKELTNTNNCNLENNELNQSNLNISNFEDNIIEELEKENSKKTIIK